MGSHERAGIEHTGIDRVGFERNSHERAGSEHTGIKRNVCDLAGARSAMNGATFTIGGAAIGTGLVGGVLFAFSSFVMPALRRIPPAQGIASMQSINRQAPTFAFMALLGGTAVVSIAAGVQAAMHRDQPGAGWVGAGTLAFIAALVITGGFNVPRNDRLASFDAVTPEAAHYWSTFLTEWVAGNHARTALCMIAAASYTVALRSS